MNIFFLDSDAKLCAQYHNDSHVIKMILEHAQLLSTCINTLKGEQVTTYKSTHVNHPCSKWVRESFYNFTFLVELTEELNLEYRYRFNKQVNHKAYDVITSDINRLFPDIKELQSLFPVPLGSEITKPALAMPDEYKVSNAVIGNNVVQSYRNYYKFGKAHLVKYTKREIPSWLKQEEVKRSRFNIDLD